MAASEATAQGIASALADGGTELLFGVPGGGANLDLVGACQGRGIRFVLTHAETAGAIMAATYAELTGRPGACLATRGPGAASLANGLAHAWLDRCPLIAVTDTVPAAGATRVAHQRLAQDRLLGACAKASAQIAPGSAAATARGAIEHALAPPWGPVHLDLEADAGRPVFPGPGSGDSSLAEPRRLIRRARRPLVIAGVGARHAETAVRALVDATGAPALTTYKAKGCIPDHWPQAAGLLTGATAEAEVLDRSDLILACGLDPVELIPADWPYDAPVVAVGPWPVPDPYLPLAAEVVGPLDGILEALADEVDASGWDASGHDFRQRALANLTDQRAELTPQRLVLTARSTHPAGTIATIDSGAHMLVAMPLWDVAEPDEALISSGLATMGFALPAAIAASLARPGRRVVCFTGDGGLGMCAAELETVARLRLPITVVVFNDATLSLIKIKQRGEGHGGEAAVRYGAVDFAAMAASVGIAASAVHDEAGLERALAGAARGAAPYLVDAAVDPSRYGEVLDAIRGHRQPVASGS